MDNQKNSKIGLLYLGSSGAGVKLTELLKKELPNSDRNVYLITRANVLKSMGSTAAISIRIPSLRLLAWVGIGRNRAKNRVLRFIKEAEIQTVLIPMAHPWDLYWQKSLQSEGIKIIRIIHDAKRHPGDLWPRNRDIEKLCNSDYVITLSKYTASLLEDLTQGTIVSCIPEFEYAAQTFKTSKFSEVKDYDLIIGRQRKYQNSKSVIKWWTKLPAEVKQDRKLIVAGRLSIHTRVLLNNSQNVIFINRWLSEEEFEGLISGANRIICLYREASQSGIISAAQSKSIPVLVSDVGGLQEQIETFGGGVVASLGSKEDWEFKYGQLNKMEFCSSNHVFATPRFISDIIRSIVLVEA